MTNFHLTGTLSNLVRCLIPIPCPRSSILILVPGWCSLLSRRAAGGGRLQGERQSPLRRPYGLIVIQDLGSQEIFAATSDEGEREREREQERERGGIRKDCDCSCSISGGLSGRMLFPNSCPAIKISSFFPPLLLCLSVAVEF